VSGARGPVWVEARLLLKVDASVFASLKLSVRSGAEWTTVERARIEAESRKEGSLGDMAGLGLIGV
jgi:hypothetical protein